MRRSLLTVTALLAFAPGAAAAPGPLQPNAFTISQQDANATDPNVIVTPDGTTIVAWRTLGDQVFAETRLGDVFVSTRRPNEDFSPPVQVSSDGKAYTAPLLGVDKDGAVTLVWTSYGAGVLASRRLPGGSFGAPVGVGVSAGWGAWVRLAVAPDGAVTVMGNRSNSFDYWLDVTTRSPDGTFSTPTTIASVAELRSPDLAVAPDGTLVASWLRQLGPGSQRLEVSVRPPGGAVSGPQGVSSDDGLISSQRLVIGSDGVAALTWVGTEDAGTGLQASLRPAGGTFGAPMLLGSGGAESLGLFAAPGGTLTALWREAQGTRESVRAGGGTFASSAAAAESDGAVRPVRVFDAYGTGSLAQVRSNGAGQPVVEYRVRPAGGPFGAGVSLSGALDVVTALDARSLPDGNVTFVWATPVAGHSVVQVRWTGPPTRAVVFPPPPKPSGPGVPQPEPPTAVRRARITGTPRVGRTLTCTRRAFTGATRTRVHWLRTSYPIPGAIRSTYKLTKRDRGKRISCEVRASGPGGSARMVSRAVLVRR